MIIRTEETIDGETITVMVPENQEDKDQLEELEENDEIGSIANFADSSESLEKRENAPINDEDRIPDA